MEEWRTSDTHWGHGNIIGLSGRPFDSLEEMNEAMVDNWNATVNVKDTVWVHGDLVMGKRDETLSFVSRLNGTIILIPGNHDHCGPWHRAEQEWIGKYIDAGVDDVMPINFTDSLGGREVACSHFPYRGDHTENERYIEFRPKDNGLWLLHGHVHEAWKVNGRQINVGVDVWGFKPVHTDVLLALMED